MALPEEYLLSPEEREKRRLAGNVKPQVRVAFGNKGLTGVENPTQPMAGGVRLPIPVDTEAPASGLPTGPFSKTQVPGPNIRIRPSTAGMSPIDRSVADLESQRQVADQFPSSRVTPSGDITPPKMHSGFKDRLKSIGKGLLIGLGAGGPGGAIAGAITGGVSPVTIDKVMAQRALERKTAQVGQQLGIERGQAQLEAEKMRPALEVAKIQNDAEYRAEQQKIQREVEQGRTTRAQAQQKLKEIEDAALERHRREMERQGQLKIDKTGTEKAGPDYATRAEYLYKQQHEAETNAAALRKQAAAIQPQPGYDLDSSQKAEKEDLLRRAAKHEEDAKSYRVQGDKAATSAKPISRSGGPTPTTHGFSVRGWLARNPGKTEADARAFHDNDPKYKSYPIVP